MNPSISGAVFAGKMHTPGPWKVYPKGVLVPGYQVCDRIVADRYNGGDSESPSDPDAKLIAASPEMLEALHVANFALQNLAPTGQDKMIGSALKVIGEAIAKAIR
jgi:hypothetical protein